jgi:hypothetical protein
VIVDTATYYALQGEVPRELKSLEPEEEDGKSKEPGPDGHTYADYKDGGDGINPLYATAMKDDRRGLSNEEFSAALSSARVPEPSNGEFPADEVQPLSDEECLLTIAWVKGFAIQSKLWCKYPLIAKCLVVWRS